ncbi:hypothetical protein O9993_02670 [Vibrio lentus]|nr:hypothetical protein [Vibrio lentus]
MLRNVDLRNKRLPTILVCSTVMMGTNIVQAGFRLQALTACLSTKGTAVFGYFKGAALKDQLGFGQR